MKQFLSDARTYILRYYTIVVISLLPLLFFSGRVSPHMSSKAYFLYGSACILGSLFVYSFFTDKSWQFSHSQLPWIAVAKTFIVWFTIAGLCAVNVHLAFWSSFGRETGLLTWYSGYILLLIVVSLIVRYGKAWWYQLLSWYTVSGLVLAISVWGGDEGLRWPFVALQKGSGGGLIGNSSLTAAYFFFVLIVTLVLLLAKPAKVWKWVSIATIVTILTSPLFFNIYGLFYNRGFVGSARGAFLGLFVFAGSVIVTYMSMSGKKVWRGIAITFALCGVVVFGYGWKQLVTPNTWLHQKFTQTASSTRFIFWDRAQKAMDERPWIGYGPENYMLAFQHYFYPKMITKEFNNEAWNDRAHNMYYDTGAQAGYPGIALYILMLIALLVLPYMLVKKGTLTRWQGAVIVGGIVGFTFQNLFIFDSISSIVGLFVLYGGLIGLYGISGGKRAVQPVKGLVLVIKNEKIQYVFAVLLTIAGAIGWYYLAYLPAQKSATYGSVFSAPLNRRLERYGELLQGSRMGEDWDTSGMAHDIFKLYATNPTAIKNDKVLLPYTLKDLPNFLSYLEDVAKRNPTDYRLQLKIVHLWSTYVFLADKPLDPVLADHILQYAYAGQKLAPTDPQVYWSIGQIAAWKGDFGLAQESYEKAVIIDNTIAASWDSLLTFYKGVGDQRSFDNTLRLAKQAIPNYQYN